MTSAEVTTILISIVGFFGAATYWDVKKIGRNVERLMINEAANKEKLEDLERRIEKIESHHHNGVYYGKR